MFFGIGKKTECNLCGVESREISSTLGVCLSCIRITPEKAIAETEEAHKGIRKSYHLPTEPPRDLDGIQCSICANECKIGEGNEGFCGLRSTENRRLIRPKEGVLHTYYDPLPTNCCASWFCPGSKEVGYNLAVFPFGCSFDCVFCQNYEHKFIKAADHVNEDSLVNRAEKAACVCYFGGTPEPQLPFLLKATKKILENKPVRICWEWNGTGNPKLVKKAAEYSQISDGVIKFDLKAYDRNLNIALTGRPNDRTLQNFRMIAEGFSRRNLLTATTLLVPGYIDNEEVERIARFISDLNPDIPYSLLAFHPDFKMNDMPVTSREMALECYDTAKKFLNRVNIGNKHLLW
ncbi:MAG: radical SAM protein [Thermoplasmatales archaeon]|nr:MAG: radical SAM protein [Thermoplasmatales archaeon]